jgi:hypothetical protein
MAGETQPAILRFVGVFHAYRYFRKGRKIGGIFPRAAINAERGANRAKTRFPAIQAKGARGARVAGTLASGAREKRTKGRHFLRARHGGARGIGNAKLAKDKGHGLPRVLFVRFAQEGTQARALALTARHARRKTLGKIDTANDRRARGLNKELHRDLYVADIYYIASKNQRRNA